ncbi:hypothetical protein QM565_00960 [Geitlerinema splendidum]|nr:hypothetical protein [Geitlerinema splendidum]
MGFAKSPHRKMRLVDEVWDGVGNPDSDRNQRPWDEADRRTAGRGNKTDNGCSFESLPYP